MGGVAPGEYVVVRDIVACETIPDVSSLSGKVVMPVTVDAAAAAVPEAAAVVDEPLAAALVDVAPVDAGDEAEAAEEEAAAEEDAAAEVDAEEDAA